MVIRIRLQILMSHQRKNDFTLITVIISVLILIAFCFNSSGQYIASGQINHMGFRAYVIIWDWKTLKEITRHELHKVRVEALSFTSDEKYLISLGGRDCGQVLVWDMEKK